MDWAAYLKHLQTVFQKFDPDAVILEPVLIRLFYDGLWPFICTQAKQDGRQKDTWEQTIKKVIIAEAKATLNLLFCVQEIDACCLQGHQPPLKADERIKEKVFN